MSNSVEKSRISEKIFKSIFKSIPFPSYVWKIVENDLILIEYNTSAEKINNGQIKDDLGRKASDIYKDQSEFYEGLSRCASSKCRVSKETKTVCLTTGEEIYISVEYSHVPPDLVLVHTEDITKKKKFEQILKREAEKIGIYLDLAKVIIVALNENGEITFLNKKGYEVLEFEEDELIGRNWFEACVPTRLRSGVLDVFYKLINGELEPVEFYENPILTKSSKEKIIAWHNTLLYDDDGKIIGTLSSGEDITERKKTEQKLKESEEKYKAIAELLPDIIYEVDKSGKLSYVNPVGYEKFGYQKGEIIGKMSMIQFVVPEQREKLTRNARRFFSGESVEPNIYTFQKKDGSTFFGRIHSRPIYKEGKVVGIRGVLHDIHKLIEIEERLKKLNLELEQRVEERTRLLWKAAEEYRLLVDNAPVGVFLSDQEGNIKLVNPLLLKILGSPSVKATKQINLLTFPPLITAGISPAVKNCIEKEESTVSEIFYKSKWGKDLYCRLYLNPTRDNSNNIIGIQGIIEDITEHKKIEQKIKESEEKFRNLLETSSEGIIEIGVDPPIVSYVNPRFLEITGYDEQELINQKVMHKIIHPDDMKAFLITRKEKKLEFRIYDKKKKLKWLSGERVNVYNPNGELITARIWVNDVTEKKKIEQKLKESEEQYRTMINSLADPLHVVDRDLRILLINPAFEHWLDGLSIEKDIVGRTIFEAFPFLPNEVRKEYDHIFNSGETLINEGSITLNDKQIETETRKIPIFKKGEVDQVITIIRDITERKNIEIIIKESEEKYRLLAENINDIIVVIDDKFQVEYINEEVYKKVLGTTKKDILGKKLLDFVHPDDKNIGLNSLLKGIKDKEGIMEIRVRHRKGHYIWFEVKGKAFLNNKGELKGILIARDITERRKAEEILRESEERYRTLVETMTDGLGVIDENSCFTYLNMSFSKMIGYSYDELLGTSIFNYLDKKNQSIVEEQLIERRKGEAQPYELMWTRKDGQKVSTIIAPKPLIDAEGNNIGSFAVITNITERIITEQKLKESEEKYRSLVETTYDWIWEVDEKAVYTYSSPKIKDILGYDVEEVIGKTPFDFMPSSEAERVRDLFQEALQSNQPIISIENKNLHKNGSIIILESSGVPFFNAAGKLLGYRGIDRDITEKMKTKQILQKTRQQLQDMFDNTPAAIFAKDLEGRYILVNNMWRERTKIGDKDPIGKTSAELFPHIPLQKWDSNEEDVFKSGEVLQFEEIGATTGRVYLATKFLMRDTDGKVYALGNVSLDITERVLVEKKLKESEEKYRRLFENSPEIIVLTNPDGVVLEYNSAFEKTFGFTKNEVVGKPYYEFGIFDSDQISIIKKRYKEISRGKQKKFEEFKVKRRDGSSLWILYQSTIVKLGNKPYVLVIAQDITENKKAEELIEKELIKLKELDEIKNELITRASHEFKTPITSILASAELFLNLFKGVYTDEMKQLIEIIYKGGKRLEDLVKNTIDISLIESKKISFRREREDIGKLINECVNDLIYLADERELSLELNVQENVFIPIDKNKITQVIKNIVSNAIKNTPPKGNISITLNRMNKHLQISIKDTGVGFSEAEKQRLFQKFGKIERYGKDFDVDIEGPGLGLYLAKQIIEMHGGKIWADSEGINKGATFIIELPID